MASESRKPPSRLAEKGQHLDPAETSWCNQWRRRHVTRQRAMVVLRVPSKHKNGSGAGCNSVDVGNNVAGKCAASEDTPDTGSGSIPYRNFKMGADSNWYHRHNSHRHCILLLQHWWTAVAEIAYVSHQPFKRRWQEVSVKVLDARPQSHQNPSRDTKQKVSAVCGTLLG